MYHGGAVEFTRKEKKSPRKFRKIKSHAVRTDLPSASELQKANHGIHLQPDMRKVFHLFCIQRQRTDGFFALCPHEL